MWRSASLCSCRVGSWSEPETGPGSLGASGSAASRAHCTAADTHRSTSMHYARQPVFHWQLPVFLGSCLCSWALQQHLLRVSHGQHDTCCLCSCAPEQCLLIGNTVVDNSRSSISQLHVQSVRKVHQLKSIGSKADTHRRMPMTSTMITSEHSQRAKALEQHERSAAQALTSGSC